MKSKQLAIPFIGARTYVHGPDIFYALSDALDCDDGEGLVFNIHGFTQTNYVQIELYSDPKLIDRAPPISILEHRSGRVAAMRPDPAPPADEVLRRESHEEQVRAAMEVDGWSAQSARMPECSPLEQAVLMKKEILQQRFSDLGVKWAFCRAEMNENFTKEPSEITLHCMTQKPSRLYKSAVRADGREVGDIFFVGMKQ